MSAKIGREQSRVVCECVQRLEQGHLAPWKVEADLELTYGVKVPGNYRLAAICRRNFIESVTGESFSFISVPENPYKDQFYCSADDLIWELDARDENRICSLCGSGLEPLHRYAPLVANYIGGVEDYFSYAGRIDVKGDVTKTFTNLLLYGTGLGPIGVTRGCFLINKLGGAEVSVEDTARAVRCLGFLFETEEMRRQAQKVIEEFLPEAKAIMQDKMRDFSGRISGVDFDHAETPRGFVLYVDFIGEFSNFRGHGSISHAVGSIKSHVEEKLTSRGIDYGLSVIAQGHDGDLKPSSRNKRGRKATAQVRIPVGDFNALMKVSPDKFLSFVDVDRVGSQKLGCPFYSGMGGEILPAIYKAAKINPHSPIVSCFQRIYAEKYQGDVVYGVELPNIEAGVVSSREGLVSPVGREAMRIIGIKTAREYAASVAAQVLAGEFNLALEISREKLYGK